MSSPVSEPPPHSPRHIGFTIEVIVFNIGTCILLTAILSQLLVYRFTPRRRWNHAKVHLLIGVILATLLLIPRNIDPNNVFDIMPFVLTHALSLEITAILLHCGALVLLNALRSLSHLIHRPITSHTTLTLFGMTTVYHLMAICVSLYVGIIYTPSTITLTQVTDILRFRDLTYDAVVLSMLLVAWYSFGRLHSLTKKHVEAMRVQEKKVNERIREAMKGGGGVTGTVRSTTTVVTTILHVAPTASFDSLLPDALQQQQQQQQHQQTSPVAPVASVAISILPSRPSFSLPSASSTARIAELDSAASKLGRFISLTTIVILLSVSPLFFLHGEYTMTGFRTIDPSTYQAIRFSTATAQYAASFLILWFAWTNPRVWICSTRPFWRTVRYGVDRNANAIGGVGGAQGQIPSVIRQPRKPFPRVRFLGGGGGKKNNKVADSSMLVLPHPPLPLITTTGTDQVSPPLPLAVSIAIDTSAAADQDATQAVTVAPLFTPNAEVISVAPSALLPAVVLPHTHIVQEELTPSSPSIVDRPLQASQEFPNVISPS